MAIYRSFANPLTNTKIIVFTESRSECAFVGIVDWSCLTETFLFLRELPISSCVEGCWCKKRKKSVLSESVVVGVSLNGRWCGDFFFAKSVQFTPSFVQRTVQSCFGIWIGSCEQVTFIALQWCMSFLRGEESREKKKTSSGEERNVSRGN